MTINGFSMRRHVSVTALVIMAGLQFAGILTAQATDRACIVAVSKKIPFTQIYDGDKPYEVRVAAAEILALYEPGAESKAVITDLEAAALLKGIVANRLTEAQAKSLPHYHDLLANLVQNSKTVERLRILRSYDNGESKPKSLSSILTPTVDTTKSRWLTKLGFGAKPKPGLEFLNAEQFSRALEGYPIENRLEVLRRVSPHLPRLTHVEAFRILLSMPGAMQVEANGLLSAHLLGRLDFFPLSLVEESDTRIDTTILARHLRESGGNYELHDLISFMRKIGMTNMQILNAIPHEAVHKTALLHEIESQANFDMHDALFFLHLALPLAKSMSELEFYKTKIAGKLNDSTHDEVLRNAFLDLGEATRLLGKSQRSRLTDLQTGDRDDIAIGKGNRIRSGPVHWETYLLPSPSLGVAKVYQRTSMAENTSMVNTTIDVHFALWNLTWLHEIHPDAILFAQHVKSSPEKRKRDEMESDLIAELRRYTAAPWKAQDMHAMGISDDSLLVAWNILRRLPGQTATVAEAYELRAQVLRLIMRSGIQEIPAEKRQGLHAGVSLKGLQDYFLSLVSGIQIQK